MARSPHAEPFPVHQNRPGLVWPSPIDPDGVLGPTPKQARGPRWRRASYGYYVPTDLPENLAVEQRIAIAAHQVVDKGAVTGWAALRWRGAKFLDGRRVSVVVPRGVVRPTSTLRVTAEQLPDSAIEEVDGIPLVSAVHAALFAAAHAAGLGSAVNAIDRAAAADLISLDELAGHALERAGRPGIRQVRDAIALASENSWSPMETQMRLLWRTIGLTEVVCNTPIFDPDGRHLGTPDLFHPASGLVGEYDGADHLTGGQRAKDIRREGAFRRVGLEYVEMVAADRRNPSDFLRRTKDALTRTERGPSPEPRWTLTPPPWWTDTTTVDRRRALTTRQRERLLRWQAA
ncbi:hypothetical protein [Nocardioides sp. Kera G14]|uniref:hypothetical protein n=1 Tax=Nocardioides sp. Kera G14 TaxID=2884264 RepID=UPI001D10C17E|nr:hypothetical protein [Nocardioides sp. Kera G14]UDY22225.1 hypothetical protein LH076_09020 [Nocardioides sp. Kera G14]